jgi:hypothetical protein
MGHFESSNWGENGGEEEASDIGLSKAALICTCRRMRIGMRRTSVLPYSHSRQCSSSRLSLTPLP